MSRKVARQDESTEAREDEAPSPGAPWENEPGAGTDADESALLAEGVRGETRAHRKEMAGNEAPPPEELRDNTQVAESEDHPLNMTQVVRRLSVATSAKFAIRAACYLAGKAADNLVSLYTRAFRLDRDYILDFNKSAGLAHARNRRWSKAIPLLEQSLAMAPGDLDVRMRLAEGYSAENQPEKARQQLDQILEIDPDCAAAVRALGVIHARRQDYDRAIECLERAVTLDSDHGPTYYRLGMAYDNRKRYDKAVEAFKRAIRLDPRFAKAYQALGFTYESMGDRESAVTCFKKALELE
jgi:tetratricopeptide (TPR) repeat protein